MAVTDSPRVQSADATFATMVVVPAPPFDPMRATVRPRFEGVVLAMPDAGSTFFAA